MMPELEGKEIKTPYFAEIVFRPEYLVHHEPKVFRLVFVDMDEDHSVVGE